jgi:hypothetical protein
MAEDFEVEDPVPEESTNRTFVIAAGALGGLLILSMICMGLYLVFLAPQQREDRNAMATEAAFELTQMAIADLATETPLPPTATTQPPEFDAATNTPVVVIPTNTPLITATVLIEFTTAEAQTQAAELGVLSTEVVPTPTPTALPATGFVDDIGLPVLVLLGAGLVIVILIVRRVRLGMSA